MEIKGGGGGGGEGKKGLYGVGIVGVLDETGPASRPNQRLCFLRFQCPHGRSRRSLCAVVLLLLLFKTSFFCLSATGNVGKKVSLRSKQRGMGEMIKVDKSGFLSQLRL